MRDKDARGLLATLAPHVSSLVVTRASNPRSAEPHDLETIAVAVAADLPVYTADAIGVALDRAWKLSPQIVVAGSIFLLGDVLKELQRT